MVEARDPDLETLQILSEDTPKPATNPKYIRIYSHLVCPFAERARITAAFKGIKFQLCEVDQSKKTPWHMAINDGFVPVLELTDGTIITESKVIMDYLEDAYPTNGLSLIPKDPVLAAKMRMALPLIE